MAVNDLTTIDHVKTWWQQSEVKNDTLDTLIAQTISRVSSAAMSYMNRHSLLSQTYTTTLNGRGTVQMPMPIFPVTKINSLVVNNVPVQPGAVQSQFPTGNYLAPWTPGYYLDPWDGNTPGKMQMLSIVGGRFYNGFSNIGLSYVAGYLTSGEAATIAAPSYQIVPIGPKGLPVADAGVTYANGTPLTPVAANPGLGQYVPPNPLALQSPTNYYLFSPADANAGVLLSYSYVPWDIEGAVCEFVAERLAYRGHLGMKSKAANQTTTTYNPNDFPQYVTSLLQPYRNLTASIFS